MNPAVKTTRDEWAARVGAALREMRRRAGITQEALADALGSSASYVVRLEAAARGADVADLIVWGEACGDTRPRRLVEALALAEGSREAIAADTRAILDALARMDPASVAAVRAVVERMR
jgi:transcriptional regulator with XRE-family HTH domain